MSEKILLNFDGYWKDASISKVPASAGIYCVYTGIINVTNNKPKLKINRLIYICDTDNAQVSVGEHKKNGDLNKWIGERQTLYYSFASLDKKLHSKVKSALISAHNTPANIENTKLPEGSQFQIITDGQNEFLKKDIIVG